MADRLSTIAPQSFKRSTLPGQVIAGNPLVLLGADFQEGFTATGDITIQGSIDLVGTNPTPNYFINGVPIGGGGGGGAPAGNNTQIQFNNNGAFGASPNLTWTDPFGYGYNSLVIGVDNSGQLPILFLEVAGDPVAWMYASANTLFVQSLGTGDFLQISNAPAHGLTLQDASTASSILVNSNPNGSMRIQAQNLANAAPSLPLLLNPLGGIGGVGIGTQTPQTSLDVNGLIQSTSFNLLPTSGRAIAMNFDPITGPAGVISCIDWGTNSQFPLVLRTSIATFASFSTVAPIKFATYGNINLNDSFGIGVAPGKLTFGAGINALTGVPQMVLTNEGRVGINTQTPQVELDVVGSLFVQTPSDGAVVLFVQDLNPTLAVEGTGSVVVTDNNGADMRFGISLSGASGWIQCVRFANPIPLLLNPLGGNIGIQKTNPGYALDVNGDINISGLYRINGVPIAVGEVSQTPWLSDIDAAFHSLTSVNQLIGYDIRIDRISPNSGNNVILVPYGGNVGINTPNPQYALDIDGSVNVTGSFLVNGVPITAGGGSQTPWLSDIDAGDFSLNDLSQLIFSDDGDALLNMNGGPITNAFRVDTGQTILPIKFAVWNDAEIGYGIGVGVTDFTLTFGTGINMDTGTPQMELYAPNEGGIAYLGINKHQPQFTVDAVGSINCTERYLMSGLELARLSSSGLFIRTYNIASINGGNNVGLEINADPAVVSYSPVVITRGNSALNSIPGLLLANDENGAGVIGVGTNLYLQTGSGQPLNLNYFNGGGVIIGPLSNTTFALDVVGDINISGVYRINGIPFASINSNTTQIDLTNVATVNGAAPGGGSQWVNIPGGIYFPSGKVLVGNSAVGGSGTPGVDSGDPYAVFQSTGNISVLGFLQVKPTSFANFTPEGGGIMMSMAGTGNANMQARASDGITLRTIQFSCNGILCNPGTVSVPGVIELCSSYGWVLMGGGNRINSALLQVNGTTVLNGFLYSPNFQTTNPGAGSKQFWADPTDGYRVKYAN